MASAASAAAAAAATSLNLSPSNRLSNYSSSSLKLSLQRSSRHYSWKSSTTQLFLSSSSFPLSISSDKLFPLNPFLLFSSSHDETVVTNDENDVLLTDDDPPQQAEEDIQSSTPTDDDDDDDAAVEVEEEEEEESPAAASILASLQSYKQALADNDDSKLSEIEAHFKSIQDEKLELQRQLAALSDELSSAKDRVLRISADFDNFRKRTERERISLVANAQGEVVENLLPVLDNFERAKAAIKVENDKEDKINNSYQSIYKQFVEILNSLGVVPVETTGLPFDPLLHEAIMREESTEFKEGVVIQEFRKGFRIGDRLLRPSMVKVSAGPGPEDSEPVSPSGPEDQAPGQESLEESEDVDQSEPSPADDE